MYEIKNVSNETVEIITTIDPSTKGCRVLAVTLPPRTLEPGQSETYLGYEPGISIVVRPVKEPERAREAFKWPPF